MVSELLTADDVVEFLAKLMQATLKKQIAWSDQNDAPVSIVGDGYRIGLRKGTGGADGLPDYTVTLYHREVPVKEFGYAEANQHEDQLRKLFPDIVAQGGATPHWADRFLAKLWNRAVDSMHSNAGHVVIATKLLKKRLGE